MGDSVAWCLLRVLASFGRRLMTPMVRAAWENTNAGSGQLF
ncbi:hypothetical protein BVI1335_1800004 [Burkholderia vietnamiensis]|nr:hypothetical protein BVI1335_1800004 [Burkholderia vietnamiensis]